ncbi:MAG: transposase, partial [Mesorhizobium sp.]
MQFTRFLRNRSVSAAEMSRHAGKQTGGRAAGRHVVAVQDSSELALGSRRARAGYGPVGNGNAAGLLLHPVLAVEAGTGALLGLVSMQVWNRGAGELAPRRQRATANKESQRWIDATKQAGAVLEGAASITMVSDRESDFYELFAERPHNVDLIVRACQNRRIEAAQE